jgi:hypothetical protein
MLGDREKLHLKSLDDFLRRVDAILQDGKSARSSDSHSPVPFKNFPMPDWSNISSRHSSRQAIHKKGTQKSFFDHLDRISTQEIAPHNDIRIYLKAHQ